MNTKFYKILREIVKDGLTPILIYDVSKDKIYLDLQTMAKSHLYLYEDGLVEGRYGYNNVLDLESNSIKEELCWEFINCTKGRDYYSANWSIFCEKQQIEIPR